MSAILASTAEPRIPVPATTATTRPDLVVTGAWDDGPTDGSADATASCPACAAERARIVAGGHDATAAVTSPDRAADVLAPVLGGRDRERCAVVLLDSRHRVLDVELVSVGSIDHTFMSPREVYRDALRANAAALVVGHNHPSGDPTPSADDVAVTTRLARAGDVLGVDLLDHLVLGGGRWRSLARAGHL